MTRRRLAWSGAWAGERGIALPLAIFALVIMSALVAGSVAVSRLDRGSADNAVYAAEAQNAAEAGLTAVVAGWDPMVQGALPVGDGTPATEWGSGPLALGGNPSLVHVDSVRRLNPELFLVRATGRRLDRSGNQLARLSVGQILRLVKPTIGISAALTVVDPVAFLGDAFLISGLNDLPPQWGPSECTPLEASGADDVLGIRSAAATGVLPAHAANVLGFPAPDAPNDPAVTSATFTDFRDFTYASLAAGPGVKVLAGPSDVSGAAPLLDAAAGCDLTAPLNLGEPLRNPPAPAAVPACLPYFPVVHATGALTRITGANRGQGLLLVDGDLNVIGDLEWAGVIIVRGRLRLAGRVSISGAVLAGAAEIVTGGPTGATATIQYSACAVAAALGGAATIRPLAQRSWVQLY